jgi:hypothetical protein
MITIGVDFHPEFQQIASVNTDTGEFQERRLAHREEAEEFYRALAGLDTADIVREAIYRQLRARSPVSVWPVEGFRFR